MDGPTGPGPPDPGTPRAGARERLPLFPLSTVLYPGLLMPLVVFEPRYHALVDDLLATPPEQRRFGVVAIREGLEVGAQSVRSLHAVGCAAELRAVDPLPDGRLRIITTGSYRFSLEELDVLGDAGTAYLTGEVEWLPEPEGADAELLTSRVREAFSAYRSLLRGTATEPDDGSALPSDPMVLSYAVSAAVLVDLPERQALLETPDTQARLQLLLDLLRRETMLLHRLPSLPAGELAREPFDLN